MCYFEGKFLKKAKSRERKRTTLAEVGTEEGVSGGDLHRTRR